MLTLGTSPPHGVRLPAPAGPGSSPYWSPAPWRWRRQSSFSSWGRPHLKPQARCRPPPSGGSSGLLGRGISGASALGISDTNGSSTPLDSGAHPGGPGGNRRARQPGARPVFATIGIGAWAVLPAASGANASAAPGRRRGPGGPRPRLRRLSLTGAWPPWANGPALAWGTTVVADSPHFSPSPPAPALRDRRQRPWPSRIPWASPSP